VVWAEAHFVAVSAFPVNGPLKPFAVITPVEAVTYTPDTYLGIPSAEAVEETHILQLVAELMAPRLPLILVAVAALPLILASTAVVLVILNLLPSQVIAPPVVFDV